MPTPLVILCPGQGAQAVAMGKAWHDASPEARAIFDSADRILGTRLGAPLSQLCFVGPEATLNRTDVSQPAIFVASAASWAGLCAKWGVSPFEAPLVAAAGLSLGEYTALYVAGAITFADALELVTLRGRAMQDAAEATPSGMVALIGADEPQAREVCAAALAGHPADVLVPANFNAPGQIVISGSKAACERAAKAAADKGLRATPLPVAGAFHSPIMAPAADRLAAALAKTPIRDPRCQVLSNVTARPHAPGNPEAGRPISSTMSSASLADSIRRRLVEQLTSPVRWAESCQLMISTTLPAHPGAELHELAPGKSLAGLMRRIDKSAKLTSHDTPD